MYSAVTMVIYSQKASLVITVKLTMIFLLDLFFNDKTPITCKIYKLQALSKLYMFPVV